MPVVNVIAGRAVDGQILPVVECLIGRAARGWEYERETLTLRFSVIARAVRFFKQDAGWTGPILAERRVCTLVNETHIIGGCVINAETSTGSGFAMSA